MSTSKIAYKSYSQPLSYLFRCFFDGALRLQPVFQRSSVWTTKQRVALLESVFRGYPIPAIFLYRNTDSTGSTQYEVLDGKQRIETLLMYTKGKFSAPVRLGVDAPAEMVTWRKLRQLKLQGRVEDYQIQIIEVDAELPDIIDMFVRLNKTGSALTQQEIRNAKFCRSDFLRSARRLAGRYEPFLRNAGIVGPQQIRRMKHIELLSELIFAAHIKGVGNKKRVVDAAMSSDGLGGASLLKAERVVISGLHLAHPNSASQSRPAA